VLGILEPDGGPVAEPLVTRVQLAGHDLPTDRVAGDALGRLRLGGVPFLPGELVKVHAGRRGGHARGSTETRIPDDPRAAFTAEVIVPPEEKTPVIGIGGQAGGGFFGGLAGHRFFDLRGLHVPKERGSVVVEVHRHGGRPARWTDVWLGPRRARTDREGRVLFERLIPGDYTVRAKAVGLLALSGRVTVRPNRTAHVTLREGPGADLEVQVIDAKGRALSYATLEVQTASKVPWVDLDSQGVQRLDPFTDSSGRRVLRHVPPGKVTLKASWGSRSASVQILLTEGSKLQAIKLMLARPASRTGAVAPEASPR
jgi:hypothetical protein